MRIDKTVQYHAAQRPDSLALVQDDLQLTYGELDQRAIKVANGLSAIGMVKNDRVVIVGENSIEHVVLILAAAKIGAVAVTLNYRLAVPEMRFVLEDAQAKVVLTTDQIFVETVVSASEGLPIQHFSVIDELPDQWLPWTLWWQQQSLDTIEPVSEIDDAFLQLYTSGTTGKPKGVVLSHRNIVDVGMSGIIAAENRPSIGDTELIMAPLFHIGAIAPLFYSLLIAVTVVIHRNFNPLAVVDTIENYRLKSLFMVPAMIQAIISAVPNVRERDYSSLKRINYGASPIGEGLLKDALEIFNCDFQQSYGMTETAGAICQLTVADHKRALNGRLDLLKSCGRPNAASEVKVVDDSGHPLPANELGELMVKSSTVMIGYWNQPEQTAQAINAGWLYTGDIGYYDEEGYVFLKDRKKDMVITGGENVYPNEVERVLLQHPVVSDVAVIGVPDEKYGESLLAFIVPNAEGAPIDELSLIEFCREHLAGYKIPRQYVALDTLPRNPSGKVLKTVLREPYWP
ncbi:long-chain-fatty-acid--CoA ligase [Oceanicoccus sagamiensis]|uniref:Acyl-CoA synthetase n=1 Tax=Oceanicoccus sagamiensis TaxID=716816 RepID=A0A1X9NLI1_9GAMM|nr:long-chain-fatty-acid--CoA ligase [Oceanicoccus sagamiensis]ARN75687.1 hypothetical protein BST96_17180 [Oceanicoccus sagamiensis]